MKLHATAGGITHPAEPAVEDTELDLLLEGIHRIFGYDFRQYARSTIRRRLGEIRTKRRLHNLSELQGQALRDPELLNEIVSALSVQVSSFFRDARFYLAFRRHVVPILKTYPSVRIWHAGCATGEEVYSIAIVLHEEGLLDKCRLYATDINTNALKTASSGAYTQADVAVSETAYHRAGGTGRLLNYFQSSGEEAPVVPELKNRVTFFQHNLVTDDSFNEFHVILCRNVLIYFDKGLQNRIHLLIYNSLVRLGILGLGANETLHGTARETHYKPLEETARLYRRVD